MFTVSAYPQLSYNKNYITLIAVTAKSANSVFVGSTARVGGLFSVSNTAFNPVATYYTLGADNTCSDEDD